MPISLNRDGDQALVEFDYSNATKNKSKKGDGFYYTFAINGGDKLHVNRHGFMAIDAIWCGKNGTMKIERVGVDQYFCEAQSGGADYPLELKQWNQNTKGFDDVQGWQMGMDPENIGQSAPVAAQPPPARQQQSQPQNNQQAQQQAPVASDGPSWDDLAGTMGHALMVAVGIWEHEGPQAATGDVAGAIERMAVSLYIDARKMGLAVPKVVVAQMDGPMQEAVQQVVRGIDGQVDEQQVALNAAADEDFGDDLPFS